MMKIILIAGKSGSGKSTLGKTLVELLNERNVDALQTEFSKYIKLYAKEMLGERKENPREFLQEMGSYVREKLYGEDFFIRRMLEDIKVYETCFEVVVISDVRLINEIEEMKKSGYKVVSIYVESTKDNGLKEEEKNHITETQLDSYNNFDYRVKFDNEEEIVAFANQFIEGEK